MYTKKQRKLLQKWQKSELKRINLLEGSVSSGKTWISLVLWAFWVAEMPQNGLYLMCAKSLTTLKRNCLLLLEELVGTKNFTFSLSAKEGCLFGRKILLEGANDARSESKIRGMTLQGAYCDELTQFPEDFFAMLLSRLRVRGAKLFATTNPDHPQHWLKKNYIDRSADLDMLVVKFLIDDNTTLDPDYITNVKKEYTGVFYDRFILGLWVVASGAIYRVYSDSKEKYHIKPDMKLSGFETLNIGLDFGGNGSKHALVCSAITDGFRNVYTLRSERKDPVGITPQQLYEWVYKFCEDIQKRYGTVTALYADSAEQTLIAGLRVALQPLGIPVKNSLKRPINDRIWATTLLMGAGRFFIQLAECASLHEAFLGALWDDKVVGTDKRLDNGTSDIDTLDAFEYSIERYLPQLIRS